MLNIISIILGVVLFGVLLSKLAEKFAPITCIRKQKSFFNDFRPESVRPEDFQHLAKLSPEDLEVISGANEITYSAQYKSVRGSSFQNLVIFSTEASGNLFLRIWESSSATTKNKEQLLELIPHTKEWFWNYAKHRQLVFSERSFETDNELILADPLGRSPEQRMTFEQLNAVVNQQTDASLRSEMNDSGDFELLLRAGSKLVTHVVISKDRFIYRSMEGAGLMDFLKQVFGRAPLDERAFEKGQLIRASAMSAGLGSSRLFLSTFETPPIQLMTVKSELAIELSAAINQWIELPV